MFEMVHLIMMTLMQSVCINSSLVYSRQQSRMLQVVQSSRNTSNVHSHLLSSIHQRQVGDIN